MCLLSDAELNIVSTNILFMLELIQLLIGISMSLYLPAMGTAGFDLFSVSGYSREPTPPPSITATVLSVIRAFVFDLCY